MMAADTTIHRLAVVEDGATIGAGVKIGPFCHVGPEVVLGEGVELISHVSIQGPTTVGARTRISPQAVLGGGPQTVRHSGKRTTLTVGADCIIREGVTLNLGSDTSTGATIVGDKCMFMALSHVAHDCVVGSHVTMANGAVMGGHCEIGDHAIIGGLSAIHQFSRIGHHSFVGGFSGIRGDLIPYGIAAGPVATLRGFNIVGMKRAGLKRSEIAEMREAYSMIFEGPLGFARNVENALGRPWVSTKISDILAFLARPGKRPFVLPPRTGTAVESGDDIG